MSMLPCCVYEGIVLSWVIAASDVGICEFDFVMFLSTWKTFLLLNIEIVCEICRVLCLPLFYFYSNLFIKRLDCADCFLCLWKRRWVFCVVLGFYEVLYFCCKIGVVNSTVASWNVFLASFGYDVYSWIMQLLFCMLFLLCWLCLVKQRGFLCLRYKLTNLHFCNLRKFSCLVFVCVLFWLWWWWVIGLKDCF